MKSVNLKKLILTGFSLVVLTGASWYVLFALKSAPMKESEILAQYEYTQTEVVDLVMKPVAANRFEFSYQSFDGATVNGQIGFPDKKADTYPVMIGIHAMGRSYPRWWEDALGDRPTVTHVNHITETASRLGYVVIAIDARNHGTRKDPALSLKKIMTDLQIWGKKAPYELMIRNTVLDYRVLLDWVERQPNLDNQSITSVGYSMGGQISLILAAVDNRINQTVAIVPPHLDDKTALVAPKNLVQRIQNSSVLLITGNDDENSSPEDSQFLFNLIATTDKTHLTFDEGHILPQAYVEDVGDWLIRKRDGS